jgi:hypothetical protein
MNEKYISPTFFHEESFVEKFREDVVKRVKEREVSLFAKNSHQK